MEYAQTSYNPPPYGQPSVYPSGQPVTGLPQADPAYGYDQHGFLPPGVNNTNVVQLQPTAATTTVVVNTTEVMPSMARFIILSCYVFWCWNPIFGAIAFFIAVSGTSANTPEEAHSRGRTSMKINLAGVLVSVVVAIIFGVVSSQL